ncbi:hypothetical protein A2Z00_03975 [Candidatus Gottesmanbacteria bacterium RBG_13_45_10]|uniref:HAD family phosphatase n=1 Tax=Candidatus Gottesmanbacteria bacterium RBG_13_45_10 TaxID=1798370 RepID=A0A1F5ZHX5_9BACT|nr:MAG: hypothetical protein A2Z00_03975 [Candidatus Gottesmanbacteria bacterium RBG_13_45_10]
MNSYQHIVEQKIRVLKQQQLQKLPSVIRAVLFDYDGVLVDSNHDHFMAWKHVFAGQGIRITKKVFLPLEGLSPTGIAQALAKHYRLPQERCGELADAKHTYYQTHHTFRLYPGVQRVIRELKDRGIRVGLVTGGIFPRIKEATPAYFLALFDVVITSDMVKHNKPHPDPYLKALTELHMKKDQAVVVENAPLGIQSANAAGIYCIAVATTFPCRKLTAANRCIKNIGELRDIIFPES